MQNQLENKVYAGFFVRFAAFAIDSMIAALVVGIVKVPFSIAAMSGAKFLKANFIFDYSFMDVFSYIGVAAYFVLLTYFAHSTPGKMLFHLEVITSKEKWTFVNILYRETIGRFLSSLLCIGYLAVLVQKDKQGFHDMLCDTYVVYKNMVPAPAGLPRPQVATPTGNVNADVPVAPINVAPERKPVPAQNSTSESGQTPVYYQPSAFQVTESHPVEAQPAVGSAPVFSDGNEPEQQERPEASASYDDINPDCRNLGLDKKSEE